nr:MAG TPA: hypothetical protein [Bacteriophage sp.]
MYSRLNKTTAVYCVNCTLYKVQKNPAHSLPCKWQT